MTTRAQSEPQRRDPWDLPDVTGLTVGVLGGTGAQGRGLARRFARAGLDVVIGSRDPQRAHAAAARIAAPPDGPPAASSVRGVGNVECARAADLVIAAVPWEGHAALLSTLARELAGELSGRIVVDCVNPMGFDSHGAYTIAVPDGSAAQQAAALLPDARVVGAFHHVPAALLVDETVDRLDVDVLVVGDDREATDTVAALAARIPGARGVYAGRLRNAGQVEALTVNLVAVNRRYHTNASLRIVGV